ncbi:MAG TPA: hypothetical protein VH350_04260 [Candidatus Sulfotelmatobacter sp.]|nr:hypothetical protein [Candidatus Sulfotelmatobacter sp.]
MDCAVDLDTLVGAELAGNVDELDSERAVWTVQFTQMAENQGQIGVTDRATPVDMALVPFICVDRECSSKARQNIAVAADSDEGADDIGGIPAGGYVGVVQRVSETEAGHGFGIEDGVLGAD